MIGTLVAQEFRHSGKPLLSGVAALGLLAFLGSATAALRVPFVGTPALLLGILGAACILPLVLVVLVMTYWRTMYGAEGYFTMTIPVRGRVIFGAKVAYGIVVALAGLALTVFGLVLAAMAFSVANGAGPWDVLRSFAGAAETPVVWFVGAALLLQLVFSVVAGAALMSIGAEARFNHLGFGAPVIGAVLLYVVMQLLMFVGLLFVPLGIVLTGPDAGSLVAEGMIADFLAAIASPGANETPNVLGLGIVIVPVLAMIALAWWGARSVDRRTSLR